MACLFLRVSSDLAWSFHDVVLACSSFLGGQAGKETHPFFRALLGGTVTDFLPFRRENAPGL